MQLSYPGVPYPHREAQTLDSNRSRCSCPATMGTHTTIRRGYTHNRAAGAGIVGGVCPKAFAYAAACKFATYAAEAGHVSRRAG